MFKLRDYCWSTAVEAILGKNLSVFVVDNPFDKKTLEAIMKREIRGQKMIPDIIVSRYTVCVCVCTHLLYVCSCGCRDVSSLSLSIYIGPTIQCLQEGMCTYTLHASIVYPTVSSCPPFFLLHMYTLCVGG